MILFQCCDSVCCLGITMNATPNINNNIEVITKPHKDQIRGVPKCPDFI